jgi:hypothetical protein
MFLIRLPPSMREAVGAGIHEMAAAMVKATDTLWDAQGGHDPTVAAASIQRSRSPAPSSGKRGDKRSSNARSESRPASHPDFYLFQNPDNDVCKFHNYFAIRLTSVLHPVLGQKTSLPPYHFRFGSPSNTHHCHGNSFPRKCWIDFSHR